MQRRNKMNKTQMINEMMRFYDENESLRRELEEYKNKKPSLSNESNRNDTIEATLIKEGRRLVFSKWFYDSNYYYNYPTIEVKEDDGKMNFITFDQWFKVLSPSILCNKNALINCSLVNLTDYFKEELKDLYTQIVNNKKGEILREAKEK